MRAGCRAQCDALPTWQLLTICHAFLVAFLCLFLFAFLLLLAMVLMVVFLLLLVVGCCFLVLFFFFGWLAAWLFVVAATQNSRIGSLSRYFDSLWVGAREHQKYTDVFCVPQPRSHAIYHVFAFDSKNHGVYIAFVPLPSKNTGICALSALLRDELSIYAEKAKAMYFTMFLFPGRSQKA